MSSFPTPITNLKLRISTGSSNDVEIFEESIPPSAISGINGIHVINNPSLIGASGAFNTKPHGTIFNSAIVTTYDDINLVPGEIIITPGNSNFVPNPIQANLSLAPLPELNTLSSSFSLNDYITKNSPAPLSFSSNNTSVITVSSAGLVTIQGVGQATITITQPASSDNVYTAATPVSRVVDVIPPPSLTWSNITKSLSIKAFPLIGDLAPSSNIPLSYGNIWNFLGGDIDGEVANDRSGYSNSLSADGTIVAIGAVYNNGVNGTYSGHVRVYKYDVTKTTAVTDQTSPDYGPVGWRRLGQDIDGEAAGDFSGYSVSLSADGTILAIGASENNANGSYSGHVRVYKYDVTKTNAVTDQTSPDYGPVGWRRLGQDIDGEATNDYSGYSVSLSADGTIVAIGASENNANGSYSGHVRVYKYDVTKTTAVTDQSSPDFGPVGWRRLGKDIDGEAAGDFSGVSVSLSTDGTIVAIGARSNNANGIDSGHVRVYKYDVTKTTAVTDQTSPDYGSVGWRRLGHDIDGEAASDNSGYSVSLSADGTIVAIGAYQNDGNGSNSGNVRVYKIDSFGNFTYTSNTPAVADVYGNIVLLRSTGETTLTATQSATSSYISRTVNATLTVSTPPPPPSSLVAHYPFDSDGNDTSTNDNHLTNNNTVTFNTVDYRQGSGAASFNGSNYFEIANDGKFSPDNFTVACWIKPVSSAGNYQSIATCRTGYSPNLSGWMMYIHPDNNLQFWTGNGSYWSGGSENLFSGFGNLNRWVHLAFTFNKATGSLVMYVDGTLTTTVSRSYANTTVNSLRIGAGATEQNAQFFLKNGTLLDDFRFYHGVLSASEISDIYSSYRIF